MVSGNIAIIELVNHTVKIHSQPRQEEAQVRQLVSGTVRKCVRGFHGVFVVLRSAYYG